MEPIDFLRKQAQQVLALANKCANPEIREELLKMVHEWTVILDQIDGKASGPDARALAVRFARAFADTIEN